MPECSIADCRNRVLARGWCAKHYQRWLKYADPTVTAIGVGSVEERLRRIGWTETESGCWEWAGHLDSNGYGRLLDPTVGRTEYLSRIAFRLWNGPITAGLHVRHRCDNPPCMNPAHLELGSHAENMRDMVQRGRSARGSRNGRSKVTEAQVRSIRLRASSGETHAALASEFGLSRAAISFIVTRRSWQHVA
jgi:hypothetical protein